MPYRPSVKEALQQASATLQEVSTSPRLDAEILMSHITDYSREFMYVHPESTLTTREWDDYQKLITRRATGEPIAYIVGRKEFMGFSFGVSKNVLIPRPETEQLVEMVIAYAKKLPEPPTILEIGTGSGAIAICLKIALRQANIIATDISPDALIVAKGSATAFHQDIDFIESDLYTSIPKKYKQGIDIIVSNPPYVNKDDIRLQRNDMRGLQFEPENALYAEEGGFDILRRIISGADTWLKPNGALFVEMGESHSLPFSTLSKNFFPEHTVEVKKDYAGLVRYGIVTPKNT